jgi:hypothetical protein
VARFALMPPLGQLRAKYRVQHGWQAALLYPRYLSERLATYARDWLAPRP